MRLIKYGVELGLSLAFGCLLAGFGLGLSLGAFVLTFRIVGGIVL